MTATKRKLLWIWLAWTAAGFFLVTQDFVTRLYRNEPIPWVPMVASWMGAMYICAAFTPAILWFGQRWPLERGHLLKHVSIHILLAAAFSVVSNLLEAPMLTALKAFPGIQIESWRTAAALLLVYGFHGGVMRYWVVLGIQSILRAHEKVTAREREALELTVRSAMLSQQLSSAQLGALKMQLQPHFLFNTLSAIMVLTQQNKSADAVQTIAKLSDLLRLTLEDVDADEVTLHRELDFLRLYLSIEQTRFQDRLLVKIDAADSLTDALVPHMVLQPIVENAIKHGLSRSEHAVLIEIRARAEASDLTLTVSDDGPGSETPMLASKGIGLSNTRDRLRHLYGSRGVLQAENRAPHGVIVTVQLPFHTEPLEPVHATESSRRR